MQGPQFLYFMRNDANQFANFDNGFLQWTGIAKPLKFSPDGWQDLSILTERNREYFGLDRTFGAPQNFVEDAAGILKTVFYTQPIVTVVTLMIWEQKLFIDDTQYGYYYELLTQCDIDFSTFDHGGETVTAALVDGGIAKNVKANDGIQYDIEFPTPVDYVYVDGINLFSKANYQFPALDIKITGPSSGTIPVIFVNKEGDQVNILNSSEGSAQGAASFSVPGFIQSAKGTNTVHFAGTFKINWNDNTAALGISLNIFNGTTNKTLIHTYSYGHGNGTATENFDFTITLAEGDRILWFYVLTPTSPGATPELVFQPTTFAADYNTKLNPVLVPSVLPMYLYKSLVAKIMGTTDLDLYADSNLLQNLDPAILFTSGDALRLIPGAFIKTSLQDFFKFMTMSYDVGIGIVNGKLRMESKSFWANNTAALVIDLGAASKMHITPATDFMFSNMKIGYPQKLDNASLGDINGKYEFCITQYYQSPNNRSQNQLDLTCPYNAGMYVMTNTMLNSAGKTTTDGDSDNDVFVFNVLKTKTPAQTITITVLGIPFTTTIPAFYNLDRDINFTVTGLLDNVTAFNVRMSPKYCLLRNGGYLRSCLTGLDAYKLIFTSADKDVAMATAPPLGTPVVERADVLIGNLAQRYFQAVKFSITTPPPDPFALLNPIRKFRFNYNRGSIVLGGFDLKTGTQPADNREQTFDLLASPDSDLSQLINVWE